MVKSLLGVNHQGFTDWLIQRVSAIVMVIYSIGMFVFFASHMPVTFADWHALFTPMWMKIATLIMLLSLLFHAWVGMWTVFTDYVKYTVLGLLLQIIVFIALLAFFFAGALILWAV